MPSHMSPQSLHLSQFNFFNNLIILFNFNINTAEQPSVDPYIFYNGVLWTGFRLSGKFPIDSMLAKNDRCCAGFASLLDNHIKKLNSC